MASLTWFNYFVGLAYDLALICMVLPVSLFIWLCAIISEFHILAKININQRYQLINWA